MNKRIIYLCPDVATPAGGIKIIYQHVEMLCANSINAYIAHIKDGFRCQWFKNDIPVRSINSFKLSSDDILVIPAVWGLKLKDFAPGVKKVIINQGAYLTFRGYPIENGSFDTLYKHPDVLAAMVVSKDNQNYLQYVFPDLKVRRVRNHIDQEIFSFTEKKQKQIAFMTRKRYEDVEQVINILRFRGILNSYTLYPINNKSEHEVAAILKDSFLFLNFSFEEGWSLPAAEAMSCGCVVVGNHGYGAKEIFKPEFSYPIDQGNIIQFARQAENIIQQYNKNPDILSKKAKQGADFIHLKYSRSVAENELMSFWNNITARQTDNHSN